MTGALAVLNHHMEPLRPYLDAEGITELVINKPNEIGLEGNKGWEWVGCDMLTLPWLETLAVSMANYTKQKIGVETPICSTSLPTGERVQIIAPPACEKGTYSFTIRKPSTKVFTLKELDDYGLFANTKVANGRWNQGDAELVRLRDDGNWLEFLKLAVLSKKNILISGATGSGKTTLSQALIDQIPDDERLLTIEDTRELNLKQTNKVHMIYSKDGQGAAKVDAKSLLEASLRMRPDRILMQELRDEAAFYYLRNVNSGHPGSITTIHANSAIEAYNQLSIYVKEAAPARSMERKDVLEMLYSLVDIVIQCVKVKGKFSTPEIYFQPNLSTNPRITDF